MSEEDTSDLHCHLNGSFSLDFLQKTAAKHQCPELYDQFVTLRREYLEQTKDQPESGYPQELLDKVWKLFGLIHKIVQDLEDITLGTVSVATNTSAQYIEIRTTPKSVANQSVDAYIDAFEAGLTQIKHNTKLRKEAYGLLSLDRTIHNIADANRFIQRILNSSNKVLVGLDISGNPMGRRTLSGTDLAQAVLLALNSHVNIAIHMGESDTAIEKQDTDAVLNALEQWRKEQPVQGKNPFIGRVRLGHCIYLTQEQKDRIRQLGLPIEVCPSCHKLLNWHIENKPHPITDIYDDVSEHLVVGTDDDAIFGGSIEMEFDRFLSLFKNKTQMSKEQLKNYQLQFRFNNTVLPQLSLLKPFFADLEQIRFYAQEAETFNSLLSQALFNYINHIESAFRKNRNTAAIIEQLHDASSSIKRALHKNDTQALLTTAEKAYDSHSLPKKIGMAICGSLCILAGAIGMGLAVASIVMSYGLSTQIVLVGALLGISLIAFGESLLSSSCNSYGFFNQIHNRDTTKISEATDDSTLCIV